MSRNPNLVDASLYIMQSLGELGVKSQQETINANRALKASNYELAEHVLDRPLTDQEIAYKTVSEPLRYPVGSQRRFTDYENKTYTFSLDEKAKVDELTKALSQMGVQYNIDVDLVNNKITVKTTNRYFTSVIPGKVVSSAADAISKARAAAALASAPPSGSSASSSSASSSSLGSDTTIADSSGYRIRISAPRLGSHRLFDKTKDSRFIRSLGLVPSNYWSTLQNMPVKKLDELSQSLGFKNVSVAKFNNKPQQYKDFLKYYIDVTAAAEANPKNDITDPKFRPFAWRYANKRIMSEEKDADEDSEEKESSSNSSSSDDSIAQLTPKPKPRPSTSNNNFAQDIMTPSSVRKKLNLSRDFDDIQPDPEYRLPADYKTLSIDQLDEELQGLEDERQQVIREMISQGISQADFIQLEDNLYEIVNRQSAIKRRRSALADLDGWSGSGIGIKKPPRALPFGRYQLLTSKLNKNILKFLTKSNNRSNIPQFYVSNQLANIIKKAIKTGEIHKQDINDLAKDEKAILQTIIERTHADVKLVSNDEEGTIGGLITAGLYKPRNPTYLQDDRLKRRMHILMGERQGGNDSKELLNELGEVLEELKVRGLIDKKTVEHMNKTLFNKKF